MTPEIGWQDMKDLFRRAGEVQRADVNIDHSTGISKGTGVVVMANKADADEAIGAFYNTSLKYFCSHAIRYSHVQRVRI